MSARRTVLAAAVGAFLAGGNLACEPAASQSTSVPPHAERAPNTGTKKVRAETEAAAATDAPTKDASIGNSETRAKDRDPQEEKRKMKRSRERSAVASQALRRQDLDKAILESRQALKIHEQNTEAMLVIAEAFYKQGKFEIVESVTNSVLKVDPTILPARDESKAYNLKGFAYLAQEKRSLAMQAFRKAADKDEKNASAWNNLGVQYMWQGDYATAESCFKYAFGLQADFISAHLNYGAALRAQGKLIEAEREFKNVLKKDSNNVQAHFNLGVLYLDANPFPNIDEKIRLHRALTELTRYRELSLTTQPQAKQKEKRKLGNELVSPAQAELYIEVAKKDLDRIERREARDQKRKQRKSQQAGQEKKKSVTEAPSNLEAKNTSAPKPQAPEAQDPKPQAPKAQAPKAQAPKAQSPQAPAPKPNSPKLQAPKPQDPKH